MNLINISAGVQSFKLKAHVPVVFHHAIVPINNIAVLASSRLIGVVALLRERMPSISAVIFN